MEKRCRYLAVALAIFILYSAAVFSEENSVFRSTKIWTSEESGQHVFFVSSKDILITEIWFKTGSALSQAKMIIEAKNTVPTQILPLDDALQYFTIGKFGIEDIDVTDTLIRFKIEKDKISNVYDNNSISLYSYESGWKKVETKYLLDDEVYYYYEARPDKITYLAVKGKKAENNDAVIPVDNKAEKKEISLSNVLANNTLTNAVVETKNNFIAFLFPNNRNSYLFIAVILGATVLFVIFLTFVFVVMKGDFYENTEELQKLIEQEMAEGIPKKDIEKEIIGKGWPKKLVDKMVHNERLPHEVEVKVKAYIQTMRIKMFSDEQIRKSLIKEGWAEDSIDDLIKEFTSS